MIDRYKAVCKQHNISTKRVNNSFILGLGSINRKRVLTDSGISTKGLICLVNAVKLDLNLIDVYIIGNKAYYYFNFRVLGRK